jgi:hypothetical protein
MRPNFLVGSFFEECSKQLLLARHRMTDTGILPGAVVYNATSSNGRTVNHWTGYIEDRRSMRVVWHAGPETYYGPRSEWPAIYTAERFIHDNIAGQRLAAAITGMGNADNGQVGEGGGTELMQAITLVKRKGKKPAWLQWLKRKLDLASVPLPVKPKIRKQTVTRRVGPCKKCQVPGCFTGTF